VIVFPINNQQSKINNPKGCSEERSKMSSIINQQSNGNHQSTVNNHQSKKILIVEDDENSLDVARILLTSAGYKGAEARDGLEAIDKTFVENPDLILMDMQLPLLDGYEATRRIRSDERSAKIPIIALTSYAMKGDREKTLDAGCNGYIEKPINPATFVNEIKKYL
jgi:CheY-like chemotaxis protein